MYPNSCVQVNLNNFVLDGVKDTVEMYRVQIPRGKILTYKVLIQIYIPLIMEKLYNKGKESLSVLERCVATMVTTSRRQAKYLAHGDEVLMAFIEKLEYIKKTNEDDYEIDEFHELDKIELGRLYGLEEGREEGKKESNRQIAVNMLEEGLPVEVIEKCTNLSLYDIESLRKPENTMMVAEPSFTSSCNHKIESKKDSFN